MKRIITIISSTLLLIMSVLSTLSVSAEYLEEDPLILYKNRLSYLNEAYDLDYMIPEETASGGDYSEIIDFFSVMSIEEFDNYILSLNEYDSLDDIEFRADSEETITPMSSYYMQKYIYGASSNNYFYIVTDTVYADGYQRYTNVREINCVYTSYPSYRLIDTSWSYTNSRRNINVTFFALKYVSETVCYTTQYKIPVTFSATGGDIYGGSIV